MEICEQAKTVATELVDLVEKPAEQDLRELNFHCLKRFAAAGLMDFGFLSDGRLASGDVRKGVNITQAIAERSGTLASIFLVNAFFGGAAVAFMGSERQKSSILPRLQAGKLQLAFALTEPHAGSDAASITTRAEARDGRYLLNGEKIYTTGASVADEILVVAKTGSETEHSRAMSVFLVPQNAAGLTIEPLKKLAGNAHPSCRVVLDDVSVAADQLLGETEGLGTAGANLRLTGALERLMVAAICVGTAKRILEDALAFSREREQFGQRICEFQSISHTLVEMATSYKIMKLLVNDATKAVESNRDATEEVCMAKYYCAEQLQIMVANGMRILGGRAYFSDSAMSRIYRETPLALYAGGTIELHKNILARILDLT